MRLVHIHAQSVFYTPLDAWFDRLTRLARKALNVPVAAIALNNQDKLWFKSVQGWNIHELRLQDSFCARTLAADDAVIVEDLSKDTEFSRFLLVQRSLRFRFYAGCPIRDRNGTAVGTFAVYDRVPRHFMPADLQALRDLADLAQREFLTAELADAQAEIIAKLDVARRSAMIDDLTRVWNRRAADELLTFAVEHAEREDSSLALCMLDVDRFKDINDSAGHLVGDKVLRRVAATLVSNVRDGDAVCRFGGDEFLIILQKASREEVERIAERIRQRVSEFPIKTNSGDVSVSVSTGIALRMSNRSITRESLLELADQALYRAKQAGRTGGRASITAA